MIKYTVDNNTVIAEFRRDWVDILAEYYTNNTYIDYDALKDIVYYYMLKVENDGFKPYGEAKCSPDDVFDEDIGKELAKKRLLIKYHRILSMLDVELLKALQNDIDFINRYKAEHKERGKHV